MNISEKISHHLEKFKSKKILLGFSGGPDSLALALVFKKLKIDFACAHLNHGLRSEAKEEEKFCSEFCKKNDIPFFTEKIDSPQSSSEEFLRQKRHDFLSRTKKQNNFDLVALAHHLDDFIEQFFLFFFRGVGDFKFQKRFSVFDGAFLRPFFDIPKEEILLFLQQKKAVYCQDKSNEDSQYTRNFFRLEIIPLIKKRFPHFKKALLKNLKIISSNSDLASQGAKKFLDKYRDGDSINLEKVSSLHEAEQLALAARLIKEQTKETCLEKVTETREFLVHSRSGKVKIGELWLEKSGHLALLKKSKRAALPKKKLVPGKNNWGSYVINVEFAEKEKIISFCKEQDLGQEEEIVIKNKGDVFVRSRKKGDRFCPLGLQGSKKVQDFFVDEKVPRFERDEFPIFVNQAGEILAVGKRLSG